MEKKNFVSSSISRKQTRLVLRVFIFSSIDKTNSFPFHVTDTTQCFSDNLHNSVKCTRYARMRGASSLIKHSTRIAVSLCNYACIHLYALFPVSILQLELCSFTNPALFMLDSGSFPRNSQRNPNRINLSKIINESYYQCL